MKRIIFACTFRDFSGTDNDLIQHEFLRSLKQQSYAHVTLVVTTFGEKNVAGELEKTGLDFEVCEGVCDPSYRYSHTQVLLNAIQHSAGDDMIVWTTVDVSFRPNFAQVVADHVGVDEVATSLPHVHYTSLENTINDVCPHVVSPGIDTICLPSATLRSCQDEIESFPNFDWGAFEDFLTLLGRVHGLRCINLFGRTSIGKTLNDRGLTNEPAEWMHRSNEMNRKTVVSYLESKGRPEFFLPHDELRSVYKSKGVGNKIRAFFAFLRIALRIIGNKFRGRA